MKNIFTRTALAFFCLICLATTAYPQVDLYLDSINVYVTKYGKIQIYSLPDTTIQLIRLSPLVGTGRDSVMDERGDIDIEDSTRLITPPSFADFQVYGSFNNNYTGLPPNALIKQNVYCWQHQNSILVKYTIINKEASAWNAIFGVELIPELEGTYAGNDTFYYNRTTKIFSNRKTAALGYKFLSGDPASMNVFLYSSSYYSTDSSFWSYLNSGNIDTAYITDPNNPSVDDPVVVPAFSTKTIAAGDSASYYLAVSFGQNHAQMLSSMQFAIQKYQELTPVERDARKSVDGYRLDNNYPNPFNPSTRITYQIPEKAQVSIKVFNALGKEIVTLVDEPKSAGTHSVGFDAAGLPSGVYFYTIQAGSFHESRKMIFLK